MQSAGAFWPSNPNHQIGTVDLTTPGAHAVDIPVVNLSLDVTLNGAPITSANAGDLDEGVMWLIHPATGERINLGDTWNDGSDTAVPPYSVQVIAGTYEVYYSVPSDGPLWPANPNHQLTCAVF